MTFVSFIVERFASDCARVIGYGSPPRVTAIGGVTWTTFDEHLLPFGTAIMRPAWAACRAGSELPGEARPRILGHDTGYSSAPMRYNGILPAIAPMRYPGVGRTSRETSDCLLDVARTIKRRTKLRSVQVAGGSIVRPPRDVTVDMTSGECLEMIRRWIEMRCFRSRSLVSRENGRILCCPPSP